MTREEGEQAPSLTTLGPGGGSKVERLKFASAGLRGKIAEELQDGAPRFSEEQAQLLKFHGVYQQEDRDQRQARKASGETKAYQMMVRTRIPSGIVTADQYLMEDDVAGRLANGTLRVTTRQGLQLHGVHKGDLHAAIHEINEALLSTKSACGDVNRNVMACPAPISTPAQAQIQATAYALAMHLAPRSRAYHEIWVDGEQVGSVESPAEDEVVDEPIYGPTYLPRKFKIGIAAPGDNCVDVYTQDIGLAAHFEGDQLAGYTVLVGGGLGMTHGKEDTFPALAKPLGFVGPEGVIPVVEAIVTVQRDYGDRQNRKHARMKYVVHERGVAWFREEVERRLGYALADPRPVTWHDVEDHLGWHQQADGAWYLGIFVENGRIKDEGSLRLRSFLRRVAQELRPGIRLTAQQNILLTDLSAEQRPIVERLLAEYGVEGNPERLGTLRHSMACPALPTCGQALAEAERVLPALMRQIEAELAVLGLGDERLSVRMTGCPNGCARPYMGDIGFVGRTKDAYSIFIGGDWENTRLNWLWADLVRLDQLAATVRPLLALWGEQRQPSETFGDFCHRLGHDRLRELLERDQELVASRGD